MTSNPTPETEQELLPCPYCGRDAEEDKISELQSEWESQGGEGQDAKATDCG